MARYQRNDDDRTGLVAAANETSRFIQYVQLPALTLELPGRAMFAAGFRHVTGWRYTNVVTLPSTRPGSFVTIGSVPF